MPWNRVPDADQHFSRLKRDNPERLHELAVLAGKTSVAKNDRHRARLATARANKEKYRLARLAAAAAHSETPNGAE